MLKWSQVGAIEDNLNFSIDIRCRTCGSRGVPFEINPCTNKIDAAVTDGVVQNLMTRICTAHRSKSNLQPQSPSQGGSLDGIFSSEKGIIGVPHNAKIVDPPSISSPAFAD